MSIQIPRTVQFTLTHFIRACRTKGFSTAHIDPEVPLSKESIQLCENLLEHSGYLLVDVVLAENARGEVKEMLVGADSELAWTIARTIIEDGGPSFFDYGTLFELFTLSSAEKLLVDTFDRDEKRRNLRSTIVMMRLWPSVESCCEYLKRYNSAKPWR